MTEKKATTKNTAKKVADEKPKSIELEINLDDFLISDYEALISFTQGDFSQYSVKEIFDILDKLIVGGFRTRKFIDSKNVVTQLLTQLQEVTKSKN
jgi:hypothetical protein